MVRGLLAVWETGVGLPVSQGAVDVGVCLPTSKELVGARLVARPQLRQTRHRQ